MSYEPSDDELRSAADKTGFLSFASSPGFRHFANLIAKTAYRKGLKWSADECVRLALTDVTEEAGAMAEVCADAITAEIGKIK